MAKSLKLIIIGLVAVFLLGGCGDDRVTKMPFSNLKNGDNLIFYYSEVGDIASFVVKSASTTNVEGMNVESYRLHMTWNLKNLKDNGPIYLKIFGEKLCVFCSSNGKEILAFEPKDGDWVSFGNEVRITMKKQ